MRAGSRLLRETFGSNTLDFFYDSNGNAYALKYNGTLYHYITNLQGDVMSIVDGQGAVVASYNYDPYGNLISDEPAENTVGHLNPIRYRGYVYDAESELYYLQSRYYDPEISRWINADILVSTGQGLLGNNMFVYCLNNPMNYVDRGGTNAEALELWILNMWWLCGIDAVLPFGDLIFTLGIILLGSELISKIQGSTIPEISVAEETSSVYEYREHTKGARPSTKGKHQKGQTRKKRDNRGEKGDARRYYLGNKKLRIFFIFVDDSLYEDESTHTVIPGGPTASGFAGTTGIYSISAVRMLD